ncbi:MAG TPA: VOC family protein [Gaiellaceae bacterium]|nr:VOC family protein [Gaiellaceae bacterium]
MLAYPDVRAAVAWLEAAFGFEERVRIGESHRSQLSVGSDGAVVVAEVGGERVAPEGLGRTHVIKVRVPDVDAAFARARDQGAHVVEDLTTWEYGERSGVLEDIGGHRWELTQTTRDVAPEEWGGTTVSPW